MKAILPHNGLPMKAGIMELVYVDMPDYILRTRVVQISYNPLTAQVDYTVPTDKPMPSTGGLMMLSTPQVSPYLTTAMMASGKPLRQIMPDIENKILNPAQSR